MGQLNYFDLPTLPDYMMFSFYFDPQRVRLCFFQLLDCFVIPVLMLLSWFFLKTRYRPVHFVAVTVCLLGVGAMVGADILAGRDQGSSKDIFLLSLWFFLEM